MSIRKMYSGKVKILNYKVKLLKQKKYIYIYKLE